MIQQLADWITYDLLGLDATSHLGVALDFFIYDTVKILMLLFTISSLMGVVNAYFPIERLRNYLMTHRLHGMQYLLASVFGAITPFCSCSSIPLFIGFVKGGIPLGVTFAFLITSPLVNEVAVAMLSEWVKQTQKRSTQQTEAWETDHVSFIHRLPAIIREAWGIVRSVLINVIIGIGIGAMMHGYVPEGFFEHYMARDNWFTVPLAVVLAVPMYANAAGIVPIIEVFVAKGIPLGTAIAFMMGVVGLSLPEATLLKKVMTWRLIGVFFGTITLFIVLLGYLFNFIL